MTNDARSGPRCVALTGASGFLGREVVARLWQSGIEVLGITRKITQGLPFVPVVYDLTDGGQPVPPMPGARCSALIHIAGHYPGSTLAPSLLHEQGTAQVVQLAHQWRIEKIIYVSAQGAGMTAPSSFQQTKWTAEEIISHSGLPYTIVRPHLIVGPGSTSMTWLNTHGRMPSVPVRPVHVADVAETIIRALWLSRTEGRRYELAGPQMVKLTDLTPKNGTFSRFKRKISEVQLEQLGITAVRGGFVDGSWISDFGLLPRSILPAKALSASY